ncbi:MAG: dephospho-CoA kinase [Asticcacaulis sp.]
MIKLGLTGSIGMGKSTIAALFAAEGVPVWDADGAVHRLYAQSAPLKRALADHFGDVLTDNAVDRVKLSAALKTAPHGFERLNALVHPLVVEDRQAFMARQTADIVLVDIPLLYETGAEALLDYVVVVSAPAETQRQRVLARPGMTVGKFAAHPRPPDTRRGKAPPRRFRHRHLAEPRCLPRRSPRHP